MNSHKQLVRIAFWCLTLFLGIAPLISLVFPPQGGKIRYQIVSLYWGGEPSPVQKTPARAPETRYAFHRHSSTVIAGLYKPSSTMAELAKAFPSSRIAMTGTQTLEFPRPEKIAAAPGLKLNKDTLAFAPRVSAPYGDLAARENTPQVNAAVPAHQEAPAAKVVEKKRPLDLSLIGDNGTPKEMNLAGSSAPDKEEKTPSKLARALNSLAAKDKPAIVLFRF
jgi:hypothetical protein